jgi:hypothetical protein
MTHVIRLHANKRNGQYHFQVSGDSKWLDENFTENQAMLSNFSSV